MDPTPIITEPEPPSSSAVGSIASDEIEIDGLESPKIVEWEDLQQELARFWSLSSALNNAKERKASLAQRLEALIKVREKSLKQRNELEEMREKVEARKLVMGDTLMTTKEMMEDVKSQRERLGAAVRMLLVAGKTLCAAHQQLQEAKKLLAGKRGHGNLRNLQRMLRMRQQYMIAQVTTLYPVKALNEHTSKDSPGSHSDETKPRDSARSSLQNVSKPPPMSSLTILGLQLTALPLKKTSFFGNKVEAQRSATVLGYIAHAVLLMASYLDVHLRYPLRLGGSRSYVHDYAPSVDSSSSDFTPNSVSGSNAKPTEFPLFLEGQDTTRAAYAIFLLNKDLEQLLNYIGAESLGPRHVLANLKELTRIIQSQEYISM